jgi:S-DNA-T family DNA segregation ATPase FtsK/SpoIIIE
MLPHLDAILGLRLEVDAAGVTHITDLGTTNGTRIGDRPVEGSWLAPAGAGIALGTTVLQVMPAGPQRPTVRSSPDATMWHRPPRPAPAAPPEALTPPATPTPGAAPNLGAAAIAVPLISGAALALLYGPRFAILAVLGPAVTLASWLGARWSERRRTRRAQAAHRAALHGFAAELADVRTALGARHRAAHPDIVDVVEGACRHGDRLWERRPHHDDFLRVEVGPGPVACEVALTSTPDDDARAVLDAAGPLPDAPVVIDAGRLTGIVGPRHAAVSLARALALRVAFLHGPADVELAILAGDGAHDDWDWAAWLPHVVDVDDPATPNLATGATAAASLVERVRGRVDARHAPVTWWIVDGHGEPLARHGPVQAMLADRGAPVAGIVLAATRADLPATCHTILDVTVAGEAVHIETVDDTHARRRAGLVGVSALTARRVSLALARFDDPERARNHAGFPNCVSLLELLDMPRLQPSALTARWATTRGGTPLSVPIGADDRGVVELDLVRDGPHALVAGTTGSGKSELLRTLVAGLAASGDTEHVNFVLVDYKGGAAFDRLTHLPHVVGVVTDLDDALATRALRCLEAELRRRERLLRDAGRNDVTDYQRARDADPVELPALPRLMVIVDEFATLVNDVPDFVDALVDIAQRGRSLGMHLVLATQRPAGVLKDAIRTNTNLRVALRVVDVADSRDVVGVDDAAHLPRHAAGAAFARVGPGELLRFQTALVTGTTAPEHDKPLRVTPWPRSVVDRDCNESSAAVERDDESNDLTRLVHAIRSAHRSAGHAAPTPPWPDPLPSAVSLEDLGHGPTTDPRFGLAEDLDAQAHQPLGWAMSAGNLLLAGLPGSGVTTAVATLAVSLARSSSPGALHVYVIASDVARLETLAALPHCGGVIAIDDHERVVRLLRILDAELRSRRVGLSPDAGAPRLVLLVDGIGALRAELEQPRLVEQLDVLERLAADGPSLGIHVAFGADHHSAAGHRLDRTVSQRVLLRLGDRHDYLHAGLRDIDPASLRPGRGFDATTGREVQVALPSYDGLAAAVAAVTEQLGDLGRRRSTVRRIGRLPERVTVRELAARAELDGTVLRVPIGLGDHDLEPVQLALRGGDHALITGPARSGKTNALAMIGAQLRALGCVRVVEIASTRSGNRPARSDLDVLVADVLGDSAPIALLVDDADLLDEHGLFTSLVLPGRAGLHVIASGRGDRLRGLFRHWTTEIRRSQIGLLLRPDDIDGELLGARLPRFTHAARVAGRGYLVCDGEFELCQVALVPTTDGADAGGARCA